MIVLKRCILSIILIFLFPIRTSQEYINSEKQFFESRSVIEKRLQDVLEKEILCLAKNIYYEAGFEPYEGKLAVATVTMNRVKHKQFPKTVCGVVYQKNKKGCQFSWTCSSRASYNKASFEKSYHVAKKVLTENIRHSSVRAALYFHNTSINPNWSFAEPIQQIGNHIFYVPKRNET
jgi:spore germination cell wall hydrolase CwlJ-like protein